MKKLDAILKTSGKGLWSRVSKDVRVVGYEFVDPYELRVYFDKRTWKVELHGLIYTDDAFLRQIRKLICAKHKTVTKIEYSEQGMQGDDYVSLDYTVRL